MWVSHGSQKDLVTLKDECFHELIEECKLACPGARLSYNIRNKLEKFPASVRKEIVNRVKVGCAPLFIACKRGQTEIVEYLITVGKADIEQRGLYEVPDEKSVHCVTPLWCAAVCGKLNVLQCLIQHGADVNAVSDSGSTPVRSACFMTHVNIVRYLVENGADIYRANYNGGTCLINSVQSVQLCRFLLKHGADVNARDIQDKTALHYAIQEHRSETTKLLLENGADVYAKSRSGDDALQTACLKGAMRIFEYLTCQISYSNERLANAHELIGSTFLEEHGDIYTAIHQWEMAQMIRESTPGLLPKKTEQIPHRTFRYAREFNTMAELENIATDLDCIRIQSLLISERILGPHHKDTVYRLMFRGASYADVMRYQRCIEMWMRALEIRVEKDSILYSDTCFTAQALTRVMIDYNEKCTVANIVEESNQRFCDIIDTFKLLTKDILEARRLLSIRPPHKRQMDSYDRVLKCITHLIFLMLETAKTEEQKELVTNLVTKLVHINPKSASTEDTLLHLCVSKLNTIRSTYYMDENPVIVFPKLDVIAFLLECGANVNARNETKSTPLHVATVPYNFRSSLIKLLLDYGAHIDQPNSVGECPMDKIAKNKQNDIYLVNYISLKCFSASVVAKNNIPFINQVPKTLENFILQHKP